MEVAYPELGADFSRIAQIAGDEERVFSANLVAGSTIFDAAVSGERDADSTVMPGDRAFQLHESYGFPIELTREMAAEQGFSVDETEFRRLLAQRGDGSAETGGGAVHAVSRAQDDALQELRQPGPIEFTGFHELSSGSTVRGLVAGGVRVDAADKGQTVQLVLERTPFYAEAGGQIADEGEITADGARLRVLDVQRPIKGLIVHTVEVLEGTIHSGQDVLASVDREWRLSACQAHSATHVLHAALRQVLGPEALQSGSYNRPGYLRLDFAWDSALDQATLDEVESVANLALRYDYPVTATYMPLSQARELGALALFGDSYDEQVRVVEMGGAWSRELCGGTHVEHSSQIGAITITGQSSVGAGVRRIEALAGLDALRSLNRGRALISQLTDVLKVQPEELLDRVCALVARLRDTERELERQRRSRLLAGAAQLAQTPADVFGVSVVTHDAGVAGTEDARALVLDVRDRLPADRPGVIAVSVLVKERPMVVVATNDEARRWGVRAGELIREAAHVLGGGGGGSDDIAQGGGTDPAKVEEALRRIEYSVGERVTSRG
jgi:alanyl-tRNA synthetase